MQKISIESQEDMAVAKKFNVTGVCIPEKHYMVDISGRIDTIIKDYIQEGKYFTINRARQYGKTTTLYLLEQRLKEKYIVVRLSFEAADDLFVSRYTLAVGLIRKISRILKRQNMEPQVLEDWNQPVSEMFPFDDLSERITGLCRNSDKEIILMIDEVDKSSDNQVFLTFLGLLRNKYLEQQQRNDHTFQSVILAGVYDIKNLKLKLRREEESKYNSPWNIASDFTLDMSFSAAEIAGMLEEYERDYHTGMDVPAVAEMLYDYTSGYPFLVSRLCKLMDEKLTGGEGVRSAGSGEGVYSAGSGEGVYSAGNRESVCSAGSGEGVHSAGNGESVCSAWTREGVQEALRMLLTEPNTLFDDLRKKLSDYPGMRRMLYEMLYEGQSFPYNTDDEILDIAGMFGYIKECGGKVMVSNRIFETRLYNLFVSEERIQSAIYTEGSKDKGMFIREGKLDMRRVLERFCVHFTDLYGDSGERFLEKSGRKFFLFYLKPIINGTGNYYVEARTRDEGRTDVIVDYLGEQYVVELKIWRGNAYNERGERQLLDYLDAYHLQKGYLLSFNFNRKKEVGVKEIRLGEKVLVEAVV